MTPEEFIKKKTAEGITRTAAVAMMSRVCGVSERRVWTWLQGNAVPPYARRLLDIWATCLPHQRQAWF